MKPRRTVPSSLREEDETAPDRPLSLWIEGETAPDRPLSPLGRGLG
ncbi:hypothetical protein [Pseudenterobacter timonensis]|nr:hypothetical protein [Pseudenterobacter timonensis]